jgi:hypothetical protein
MLIMLEKTKFLRRFLMIAPLVKMLKNSAAVVTVSMLFFPYGNKGTSGNYVTNDIFTHHPFLINWEFFEKFH